MKDWQEEQIEALLSIKCEQKFFDALVHISKNLGFEHCAYGIRVPFPVSRPKVVMFNTYSTAWQSRYRERNYLAIDPTVEHCIRSALPITWSDELFASSPELWEEARSHGLEVGWAQSSRDASGVGGMLTLARSGEPLTGSELRDKHLKMTWLTQVAHLGMSQCLAEQLVSETGVQLTRREAAILRWTADGKTSGEIAEIIGISERTVNFHVNNAVAKLGVANKTAAAVKVALLGLVY